ncbi:MAG TPA: mechanosensitive ion channel domain-containing protein [Flavisolibacter sp.]|nr:mechanosensitive ion channel domain-containing protein [Flavisolibacter sp.]
MCLVLILNNAAFCQHTKDTVHFKKSEVERNLVLSDSALNAIGIDSLLNKIEYEHNTLNRINNTVNIGFDTRDIDNDFPGIDSSIDIISENLVLYNKVLDVKNLQMFEVLLADIQQQLNAWRNSIFKYERELVVMNAEIASFKKDTILTALLADSAFNSLYNSEIKDLEGDQADAQKAVGNAISKINHLQAELSAEYFESIDIQNSVSDLLRKASVKSIGKEYAYLWELKPASKIEKKKLDSLSRNSYKGQRRILRYYFRRNWDDKVWMLLTGLVFLIWVFRNFSKLEKNKGTEPDNEFKATFIKKVSILSALVVIFNLSPFFDIHPPTAFVETMEFLLVIVLTILLWRRWPRDLFYYWLAIGALYISFSFTAVFLTPGIGSRTFLLVLNTTSVIFGIFLMRKIKDRELAFSGMIKFVTVIYIFLNALAIICNLFGRLSLAKIFSITAIFGLTQIIGLSVFIQIMLEAFQLQAKVNQLKGGLTARLNFEKMQQPLSRGLKLLSICIWTIVFAISLNVYNLLFKDVTEFLIKPRKIGSTSFEIGNILLFLVIIYVSNLLQKGIGSLYGRSDNSWDPEVRKNGSRLAITRLILIVIGFLIAVAASGLPLDKITIVLGALGVGIGLGLQSIVNNLVSGIILIFEQPFRIGDYIELGNKKGRVLDIGIRSSKLVMEEGAELMMPNADLLSGMVINWTLRNDDARIEIPLSIEPGHDFRAVEKIIMDALDKSDYVLKNARSEVLLTSITDKAMSINVLAWITNVHKMESIRSQLLNEIYASLVANSIKTI